jgi:hypothetical protein
MGGNPLAFEANLGQTGAAVRFVARGAGFGVWLTDRGATLALRDAGGAADVVLGLEMAAAAHADAVPSDRLRGSASYFRGSDPARWVVGAPRYARVTYPSLHPGVDLVFHGEEGRLEYDFIVAPGATPEDARLSITGSSGLFLDESGDLLIRTRRGVLRQPRPTVYQDDPDGTRRIVEGAGYRLVDDTRVAFAVPSYDATRALVIDPVLLYASYIGGSSFDEANAVAVDASGNVYLAGLTASPDFPTAGTPSAYQATTGGSTDAFVAKLDPTGTELLYSTYLGGSSEDAAYAIALDASGSAYVTGNTESTNFPVFPATPDGGACPVLQCYSGGASNAFVTKLDPAGTALVYSTYLGGSGYDIAHGIALDALGSAYLAGSTQSPDFPTSPGARYTSLLGAQNAFVAKLSPGGTTLLGGTYLGGSQIADGDATYDGATGIAVDALGSAYVVGYTQSTDFPVAPAPGDGGACSTLQCRNGGTSNAFVTELAPSFDALVFSTYLGGSGQDSANAIALDASGDVFVAGSTTSADFPVENPYQSANAGLENAFVAELAAGGASLVYSTYLGGRGMDAAAGLALDTSGTAYVVGQTTSTDFPVRGAFQSENQGSSQPDGNAFVAILPPGGRALAGSSYLGGPGGASGQGIALGPGNAAWMVGGAGAGLPTMNALYATFEAETPNGQNAFLARMSPEAGTQVLVDSGAEPGAPEGSVGPSVDASGAEDGPGVIVVSPKADAPTAPPAPSGCGCRQADSRGRSAGTFAGALLFGALLGRRRRSRAAHGR